MKYLITAVVRNRKDESLTNWEARQFDIHSDISLSNVEIRMKWYSQFSDSWELHHFVTIQEKS